jgi:hypothetical protein
MNIEIVQENIINEYSGKNVHEQVLMQLAYLKYWVLAEEEDEESCKKIGIPYIPSRRRDEDIYEYKVYKKEIEENGDKNLLVKVNMNCSNRYNKRVIPFARRSVYPHFGTYFLVRREKNGAEILIQEDEVEIVK